MRKMSVELCAPVARARGRRWLLGCVAVLASGCASVALAAPAVQFNVPKQGLDAALMAYAQQANIQLVIGGGSLGVFSAQPLQGRYDRDRALQRLIGHAPVEFQWINETTLTVRPASPKKHLAAFEAAVAPPAAEPPHASALEEVVVTARRREENLQTTPVAVTAITTQTLERRGVVALDQIARAAPSLTIIQSPGGLGSSSAWMRGIGTVEVAPGQDSPVAIYLDGVVSGRVAVNMMPLVEPDRVEVLRGPQGTLFGRNTAAGAILITSHTPTDEFSGMAKASYGSFAARSFQARIDTGLLGQSGVKLSAAFQSRKQNGTFDAPARPDDLDPGAQETESYWFKAVGGWGGLTATLTGDYTDLKGTPTPTQIIDANAATRTFLALSANLYGGTPYTFSTSRLDTIPEAFSGVEHVWSEGLGLTLTYKISDALTLKSISGLRAYKRNDPYSLGPATVIGNVGTAAAPRITSFDGLYALSPRKQSQRQKSQELQALGTLGDFDYVAGVYYFKDNPWDSSRTRLPSISATGLTAFEFISDRTINIGSRSVAAFLQANWRPAIFDKKLELSGGIRRTKDKRDFVQSLPLVRSAHLKTTNTSWLASASYQWTPNLMTFARYSTGYRAGGFNIRAGATVDPVFKPENLKSMEGGFKFDFLDNRVRLNGSAFYNKYHGLQATEFVAPAPGAVGGNLAINTNARYQGYELELQAIPIDGLTLAASVGHLDRKYTSYPRNLQAGGLVAPGCAPITASGALIGQDCANIAVFAHSPKTTADLSANYALPRASYGELSFFAAYSYKSTFEFSAINLPVVSPNHATIAQPGYGLLSARIALSDIPLSGSVRGQIAIFGDNLTDKSYSLQGTEFGTFAAAFFGPPRTLGIEAKVQF